MKRNDEDESVDERTDGARRIRNGVSLSSSVGLVLSKRQHVAPTFPSQAHMGVFVCCRGSTGQLVWPWQ